MIVVDDVLTPRWIRELDRYRQIKNLIFLHGNVLDLVTYAEDSQGAPRWVNGEPIDAFLRRFLTDRGYAQVGILDPLNGLEFAPIEGQQANGQPVDPSPADRQNTLRREPQPKGLETPAHPSAQSNRAGTGGDPLEQAFGAAQGDQDRNDPGSSGGDPLEQAFGRVARAMTNRKVPSAFVIHLASRFITTPSAPNERELRLLTQLQKASLQGVEAYVQGRKWNNLIIVVCDKLNDFPPFLYVDNPRARSIQVDRPDRADRERFCRSKYGVFYGSTAGVEAPPQLVSQFAFLTDGLSNYELQTLLVLSKNELIPLDALDTLINRYKFGIRVSEWDSPGLRERIETAEDRIRRRVKGQDAAVARALDLVKRAWLGLAAGDSGRSHRPRGVLFFAGPTGVGKTEMAKALAELLFGSEERMLRFDMSEYAAEHADQRLLGAPPGYVGYEEGGQLTRQVKERPFSVLLFDEIEKAHPRIFDKFLQILDDGRLTDGKGDTVYFSETVIIFTSNLGVAGLEDDQTSAEHDHPALPSSQPPKYMQMRDKVMAEIQRHFNEQLRRPEILNRFGDNFVVFDFIRPDLHKEIVAHLIAQLVAAMGKVHRIELTLSSSVLSELERLAEAQLAHGGRGIRNLIDRALVDPIARWLFDQGAEKPVGAMEVLSLTDNGHDATGRFGIEVRSVLRVDAEHQALP